MPPTTPSADASAPRAAGSRPRPQRRGAPALLTLGAVGSVLLGFAAAAGSTVMPDGTLVEPFAALALGTLTLTVAGLLGLGWLFVGIRRRSSCGRGRC